MELSIIVVSFNSREVTLDALRSLYRYPPPVSFEVIVLDNRSSDGSAEAIRHAFPQVAMIENEENIGFAAANNVAAAVARGRRLLLLNPDTVTLEGTNAALWGFAEREPARGIWGGRTIFADGSPNWTSCWRRMTLWSLFCMAVGLTYLFPRSRILNSESYGDWSGAGTMDVDIVTGCFLLIDADLWRRLEGFDRTFFMYAEEADLCLRARKLGARPGVTADAEIIHLGGVSEVNSAEKIIKTIRGRVTLMRKHWSGLGIAAGSLLFLIWSGLRVVGSKVLSGPNDAPAESAGKWRQIWSRRSEWLAGY